MGEKSSLTLLPQKVGKQIDLIHPVLSGLVVFDYDGDIEIKIEESGRFTVMRKSWEANRANPSYQLIGNFSAEWSAVLNDEVEAASL